MACGWSQVANQPPFSASASVPLVGRIENTGWSRWPYGALKRYIEFGSWTVRNVGTSMWLTDPMPVFT